MATTFKLWPISLFKKNWLLKGKKKEKRSTE